MAIDYGQKRVGIAVSDLLRISANGLTTLSINEVFPFLEKYLVQENVEAIVVGFPRQMNGKESESMKYIRPFVTKLSLKFPQIELIYEDERFTSVLAHKTMLEGGLKKKDRQNKALVDKISATIILQSYLESVRYKNNRNT